MLDHRRCEALIARNFERGRLSDREAEAMRAHVRTCERCERVYERHASAEAVLFAGASADADSDLTHPGQLDRVAARLFGADDSGAVPAPEKRSRWAFGGGLAAAAAVAAVVVTVGPEGERPIGGAPDGLQSRQGAASTVSSSASLRALRVRITEAGPRVTDLASGDAVRPGDRIALLYTNLGTAPGAGAADYVSVDRVTPGGDATTLIDMAPARDDVEDERLHTIIVDDDWASGVHILRGRFVDADGNETTREVRVEVE